MTYPFDDGIVGVIERWHLISIRFGLRDSYLRSSNKVKVVLVIKSFNTTLDCFFIEHRLSKVSTYFTSQVERSGVLTSINSGNFFFNIKTTEMVLNSPCASRWQINLSISSFQQVGI